MKNLLTFTTILALFALILTQNSVKNPYFLPLNTLKQQPVRSVYINGDIPSWWNPKDLNTIMLTTWETENKGSSTVPGQNVVVLNTSRFEAITQRINLTATGSYVISLDVAIDNAVPNIINVRAEADSLELFSVQVQNTTTKTTISFTKTFNTSPNFELKIYLSTAKQFMASSNVFISNVAIAPLTLAPIQSDSNGTNSSKLATPTLVNSTSAPMPADSTFPGSAVPGSTVNGSSVTKPLTP